MDTRVRYAHTTDGVAVAYAAIGAGPPLLVARPLLRAAVDDDLHFMMDPWLANLAERRMVVLWDSRGSGLSGGVEPQYTLETALLDLEAVAAAVSPDVPIDLIASLTPTQTALAFAARQPERVRRLILVNPSAGFSPRTGTLVGLPDIVESHFKEFIQLAALRIMGWERATIAQKWERIMLRQFTPASWTRLMDEMEALDASEEAPLVRAPTLIVIEEQAPDQSVINQARRRVMRELTASIKHGEMATVRSTAQFLARVDAFLETTSEANEGSGTAVILFADLVDSTALNERLGDAAFRERQRVLDTRLRAQIERCGGSPIAGRTLGDGVLASFSSARDAIAAALALSETARESAMPLHLGIHAGDVLRDEGNVWGGAVNIAARISALTAPNEILVSTTVRDLARTSAGVTFEDRGEQQLKGVDGPIRVFAIRATEP